MNAKTSDTIAPVDVLAVLVRAWFRPVQQFSGPRIAVISPTRAKAERKDLRAGYRALRNEILTARRLIASGHILDREEAEGILCMACIQHHTLRARRRWLASVVIESFHDAPHTQARRAALARCKGGAA